MATFGWSYGGFASAHIGGRDAGATVKCNIAVAPVTDFRLYDSAYTERYMLLPAENAAGYEATSLLNASLIASFKTVKLLLAHGLSDDNVHFQNSALFAHALQENNVHFTQLVCCALKLYPDRGLVELWMSCLLDPGRLRRDQISFRLFKWAICVEGADSDLANVLPRKLTSFPHGLSSDPLSLSGP